MTAAAFERLLSLVEAKGEHADRQALDDVRDAFAKLESAKQAAAAANEAKTRFLASVSHEIRSPLNAIYGYAQLLERGNGQDALRAGTVIRRSSEYLSHLIEGLLDIAQVESGAMKLSRDAIRFRILLEQLIDMLELQAQAKGLALILDCAQTVPDYVQGDQKRLQQVLINLISNAIKFTDVGSVTLKVDYRNDLATFAIIDTGIGIAHEDIDRIFAPFERIGGQAAGRSGIGLGLAIAQALVRIMGGDIQVTSKPGQGSRFVVRLMLSQPLTPPTESVSPAAVSGFSGPPRRLLVIDDDAAHLAMLAGLLEPLGFIVKTASDGPTGLARAAEMRPDLVLLDVSMPGMSGWEVATQLRQQLDLGVRIVMLSGDGEHSGGHRDEPPPHDAFVLKPFEFGALISVIGAQLRLTWQYHCDRAAPISDRTPNLPPAIDRTARPHFAAIEKLVRIGHVRAIEAEIDAIARLSPEAAMVADRMRVLLDQFDLRALSHLARVAQCDEH